MGERDRGVPDCRDESEVPGMKFTISGRLPALNDYTKACRGNKYLGAKMKKDTEELIRWYIRAAHLQQVDGPVFVWFTWIEKDERRDPDNVAFGKKFIFDALVAAGIIPNDNRKYVRGFQDEFRTDKQNPRIEVEIMEVER